MPTVAYEQHRAGERAAQTATARRGTIAAQTDLDAVYEYVAENYGPEMLAMLKDPEIAAVFRRAYAEQWTPGRVQVALSQTRAYRESTSSQRQYDQLLQSNPAEAQRLVADQARALGRVAQRLGVNLPAELLESVAKDSVRNGWANDQARVTEALLAHWSYSPETGMGKGALAATAAKIRRTMKKYGLPISDISIATWSRDIALGVLDQDVLDETLLEQAKARYPQWADLIDRGMTPDDITSPYRQVIANELEIDPATIDFADPQWSQVIDGAGTGKAMTMTEAARWARTQPGWKATDAANRKAADLEATILRIFGKVA